MIASIATTISGTIGMNTPTAWHLPRPNKRKDEALEIRLCDQLRRRMPDEVAAELKFAHAFSLRCFELQGNRIGCRKLAGGAPAYRHRRLLIGKSSADCTSIHGHHARASTRKIRLRVKI